METPKYPPVNPSNSSNKYFTPLSEPQTYTIDGQAYGNNNNPNPNVNNPTVVNPYGRLNSNQSDDGGYRKISTPYFTYLMILINVIVFIISIQENGWKFEDFSVNPFLGPSIQVLEKLGAQRTDLLYAGDWYRLFTSMFLHAGVLHLLFNMFALYRLGSDLECRFNTFVIIFIYLLAGLMGSTYSAILVPDFFGVGASGAIFGLFGASFGEFLQNHHLYEDACTHLVNLIFITALNFAIGLLPYINNFAHIFGFLTGFMIALFLCILPEYEYTDSGRLPIRPSQKFRALFGVISLVVIVFIGIISLVMKVDANEVCSWCKYLSCIETSLWSCSASMSGGQCTGQITNGRLVINCPNGQIATTSASNEFTAELCRKLCF